MKLRKACKIGLLSLLLAPESASAQTVYSDPTGTASLPATESYNGSMPFGSGYFWARGDVGKRPGVVGDYFSVGTFAPIQLTDPSSLFFVEGEAWVNEQAFVGGNVGIGERWLLGEGYQAVGINGFLTWDSTNEGNSFQRASVGAEWMTNYLTGSVNGYLPFDTNREKVGGTIFTNNSEFIGHNLVFLNQQRVQQQMAGMDAEIGSQIPGLEWLSLFGGVYYFDTKYGSSITGASGRAMVDLTCAVFDLTVQNDSTFGTTVNFGAEIRTWGGPLVFAPRSRDLMVKYYDRVRKRSRIAVQDYLVDANELAINPATGQPYIFDHVDNTAAAGGDGTDENRYDNLGLATGGGADIILVHRGDTTRANLLSAGTGLTLSDGQIVLGEGIPFLLQTANRTSPVALPDWSQSGTSPFVTADPGADIITLADNNQVLGLNMISSLNGNMIAGNGVRNFTIQDINIDIGPLQDTGSGGGIVLTNASGSGEITRFNYRADNIVTADGGIVIRNFNTAPLNLTVQDSAFLEGGVYGVELFGSNSSISSQLTNVHALENQTGILLQAQNNGNVVANVTGSSFNDAQGLTARGIAVVANSGGNVDLMANNTDATGSAQDNVNLFINGGSATVSLSNGDFTSAGDDGLDAADVQGGTLQLTLSDSDFSDAADNSLVVTALAGATANTTIDGSHFDNAGSDAARFNASSGATSTVTITDSTFNDAGLNGLVASVSSNASLSVTATDSDFLDAGTNGVSVIALSGTASLTLENVTATGADTHGLSVISDAGDVTVDLDTVNLGGAAVHAINLSAVNGSEVNWTGDAVSGAGAGQDGIHIYSEDSVVAFTMTNLGSFAGAGDDGVDVTVVGGAFPDFQMALSGPVGRADFTGAGNNGLEIDFSEHDGFDAGTPIFSIENIDFSNATNDGFLLTSLGSNATSSTFNGLVTNSLFENAGNNALTASLDYNIPESLLTFVDSSLANPAGDAYNITANHNTDFTVIFDNTDISGGGFFLNQLNGSTITIVP